MKLERNRRAAAAGSLHDLEPLELARVEGGMMNLARFEVGYYSNFTIGPNVGDPDPYNDDHFYPGLSSRLS